MAEEKVFISYSRKDSDIVRPLVKEIEEASGIKCWIDLNGIESGDEFEEKIVSAIDKVSTVIFMLSDNAVKSEYVKLEIQYAKNSKKKVVPVVIDGGELRGWFLFKFGGVDYIDIAKPEQKKKLIMNLKSWFGDTEQSNENDSLQSHSQDEIVEDVETTSENEPKVTESDSTPNAVDYTADPLCVEAAKYENGDGVPEDLQKAYDKYALAAKKGNPYAMYKQADFLYEGLGCEQDFTKSLKFYKKAYDSGYVKAAFDIAFMLDNAKGCSQNEKKAFELYTIAVENGDADAMTQLAYMYEYGTRFLKADKDKAIELFTRAVELGQPLAHYEMGLKYYTGEGVCKNVRTAAKYFRIAANEDIAIAQVYLGYCYADGTSVKQDDAKAFEWYMKAAENGEALGCLKVADSYFDGIGVEQNEKEAFTWYQKAAEDNNPEALFMLGKYYYEGIGVDIDMCAARKYFTQSSSEGYLPADRALLDMEGYELAVDHIEEIKSSGKGQVLSGTIVCPVIRVGDTVRILCSDGYSECRLGDIHIFKIKLDEAFDGNNVDLLLEGLKGKDVKGAIELYRKVTSSDNK